MYLMFYKKLGIDNILGFVNCHHISRHTWWIPGLHRCAAMGYLKHSTLKSTASLLKHSRRFNENKIALLYYLKTWKGRRNVLKILNVIFNLQLVGWASGYDTASKHTVIKQARNTTTPSSCRNSATIVAQNELKTKLIVLFSSPRAECFVARDATPGNEQVKVKDSRSLLGLAVFYGFLVGNLSVWSPLGLR